MPYSESDPSRFDDLYFYQFCIYPHFLNLVRSVVYFPPSQPILSSSYWVNNTFPFLRRSSRHTTMSRKSWLFDLLCLFFIAVQSIDLYFIICLKTLLENTTCNSLWVNNSEEGQCIFSVTFWTPSLFISISQKRRTASQCEFMWPFSSYKQRFHSQLRVYFDSKCNRRSWYFNTTPNQSIFQGYWEYMLIYFIIFMTTLMKYLSSY